LRYFAGNIPHFCQTEAFKGEVTDRKGSTVLITFDSLESFMNRTLCPLKRVHKPKKQLNILQNTETYLPRLIHSRTDQNMLAQTCGVRSNIRSGVTTSHMAYP